ncbi:MAG: lipid-A-disaccharide synthase, partial [Deltaproteobacteria bacterium]|nr:lipid-A-disaccharide synthase [Deltaproteobacteria bacterium]
MISAGEASGEAHAAALVDNIRCLAPGLSFFGLGGPAMARAGVELVAASTEIAVTGLAELAPVAGRIIKTLRALKTALKRERPLGLILIDFPDFNFRLARAARRLNIPVIYYIPPQIWAWRAGRANFLKKNVRRLIVVLPFEDEWYRRRVLNVFFAGHPLADRPPLEPDHSPRFLAQQGLDPGRPTVGLLPGSRRNEIKRHLPLIVQATRRLKELRPDLQFLLPAALGLNPGHLASALAGLEVK